MRETGSTGKSGRSSPWILRKIGGVYRNRRSHAQKARNLRHFSEQPTLKKGKSARTGGKRDYIRKRGGDAKTSTYGT